jgi:hypothetical protein
VIRVGGIAARFFQNASIDKEMPPAGTSRSQRTHEDKTLRELGVPLLAFVVIPMDIPQATTAPNETELNRISARPDLARPD